jgi:hypothetical protein
MASRESLKPGDIVQAVPDGAYADIVPYEPMIVLGDGDDRGIWVRPLVLVRPVYMRYWFYYFNLRKVVDAESAE